MKTLLLALLLLQTGGGNGRIAGRVLSAHGRPAPSVRVVAVSASDDTQASGRIGAVLASTQTDGEGRYSFEGLPAGRVAVIAGGADVPTALPRVSGAAIAASARLFTVVSGRVSTLGDLSLEGTATVGGRVTPSPGPIAGAQRALRVSIFSSGAQVIETAVGADGSFRFTQVPSGPYVMRLGPASVTYPTQAFFVGDRDVTDLEIRGPVVVIARVIVEGGGRLPLSAAAVNAGERGADALVQGQIEMASTAPATQGGRGGNGQILRADGVVPLFVFPGDHRVSMTALPPGYTVKSVRSGNVDLLQNTFKVSGPPAPEIEVTLAPPATATFSVRGRVTGLPADAGARGRAFITTNGARAPINPDGTFELPGLPPGTRTISLHREGPSIYSGQTTASQLASTGITIANADVNGVELAWKPLAAVTGRVTLVDRAGNPMTGIPTGAALTLTSRQAKPIAGGCDTSRCRNDILKLPMRPDGTLGASGAAQLLPPRVIDVQATLPAGYSMKSMSAGSISLLFEPLRIEDTTGSIDIQVVIQNAEGVRVRGRVITSTVTPLLPKKVTLRGPGNGAFTAQTPVNSDGTFEFLGVPSGNYTLQANPDASATAAGSTTSNIVVGDREIDGVVLIGVSATLVPSTPQYANEVAALMNVMALQRMEAPLNATRRFLTIPELIAAGSLSPDFAGVVSGYRYSITLKDNDVSIAAIPDSVQSGRYEFYSTGGPGTRFVKFTGKPASVPRTITTERAGRILVDGVLAESTGTCGNDAPVCIRFGLTTAATRTPEAIGRVAVAPESGGTVALPSNLYIGLISAGGEGNLMGLRPDGQFRVGVATQPGEYRLSVNNLPDGYSVKSAKAGDLDLLKDALRTGANGEGLAPIDVVLEYKAGAR